MFHQLNDEQRTRLESMQPLRVVVRLMHGSNLPLIERNPDQYKLRGLCEESFGMDWYDERVQIYWSSGNAISNLGGSFKVDAETWSKQNHKQHDLTQMIFDPLADDCPIAVDWLCWLEDLDSQKSPNFKKRNARFKVKSAGLWQMRALVAEAMNKQGSAALHSANERCEEMQSQLDQINNIINPPTEEE
jgi:hypothetical protein